MCGAWHGAPCAASTPFVMSRAASVCWWPSGFWKPGSQCVCTNLKMFSFFLQAQVPGKDPGMLSCTVMSPGAVCRPVSKMLGLVWASVGRETNAQVRTTIVPTHVTMGVSHNVVPSTASVRLDVRLLQGDGSEAAFQGHVERMAARARRDHKSVLIIERDMNSPVPMELPSNVRCAVACVPVAKSEPCVVFTSTGEFSCGVFCTNAW